MQADDMSEKTTTKAPDQNNSRTPDFLSPGAGYTEAPLVHQPRPTSTSHEGQPAAKPAQEDPQASGGIEVIVGPDVEEAYDTELHDQQGNKQLNSANATMGVPAHLKVREVRMKNNTQSNSPGSKMGRF